MRVFACQRVDAKRVDATWFLRPLVNFICCQPTVVADRVPLLISRGARLSRKIKVWTVSE